MGSLRKILVVRQGWQPPGGANTVASWVVEALKSHYALTLLAWNRVNTEETNPTLHLVGTKVELGDGPKHYHELRRLVVANSDWVTLHENLSRHGLSQLTAQVRYGIHAQVNEHFGIAPAEILMSGGIPFVHNSGGQVEISGRGPRLCFTTQEDAVNKITTVMRDHRAQEAILESLAPRKKMFTCERFVEGIREAVRGRLDGRR